MNASRRINWIGLSVLVLALLGAAGNLYLIDRSQRGNQFQDVLYISSPKMLKRMSLGYSGLLADIYWTRAVQYFGYQHHIGSKDFHLLAPLLDIATQLDPKLTPAYEFGSNFLSPKPPNGAGDPQKALELVKYGVEHNPNYWRLYYNLGFLYYTEFNDYSAAADAFSRGAKLPVTNEFMPILAARMAQHAGEFDTARMLWFTTYQNTKDAAIKQNAIEHLRALRVDEDVTEIEKLVTKYSKQTGRPPRSMNDLENLGLIRGVPQDPLGHPYKITPDGRVEVQNPDPLLFITKGLPPGHESPQPKPPKKS